MAIMSLKPLSRSQLSPILHVELVIFDALLFNFSMRVILLPYWPHFVILILLVLADHGAPMDCLQHHEKDGLPL